MQLLIIHKTDDFDGWKGHFDQDAEDRAAHGLSTLQVWRGDGTAAALFEVANPARAREFLGGQMVLFANRAGVENPAHHFLETA